MQNLLVFIIVLSQLFSTSDNVNIDTQGCLYFELLPKENIREYYELTNKFTPFLKEEDFDQRQGYMLNLIFILKKDEEQNKDFKIHQAIFKDIRDSLRDEEAVRSSFKKIFIELQPKYMKLLNEEEVKNCDRIIFQLKLRAC